MAGILDEIMQLAFGDKPKPTPAPMAAPTPDAVPMRNSSWGPVSHFGGGAPDLWATPSGVPLREAPGGSWVEAPWMLPESSRSAMPAAAAASVPMPERRPDTGGIAPFRTSIEDVTPQTLADLDRMAGYPASAAEPAVTASAPTLPPAAGARPPSPAAGGDATIVDALRGFSRGYREGGLLGAFTEALGGVQQDRQAGNKTAEALVSRGLEPAIAEQIARDPALLKAVILASAKAKVDGVKYGVNPKDFQDADGNLVSIVVADDGSIKRLDQAAGGKGLTPVKAQVVDLGDRKVVVNKLNNQTIGEDRKVESYQPSYDKEMGQQEAKADAEEPVKRSKAIGAYQALSRKSQIVSQDLDRAIGNIANGIVPRTGQWSRLKDVAGTPQHNLNELLKGILANVGFDELQQMRDNSPTGGALGSITEKEIAFLQALRGSLEQSQTEDQLLFNLQRIKQGYTEIMREREQAFARDFGGSPAAPAAQTTTGAGGQTRRRYNPETGRLE